MNMPTILIAYGEKRAQLMVPFCATELTPIETLASTG